MDEFEQAKQKTQRLKAAYKWLYDELLAIFARHDPIHLIDMGAPDDEYSPEVEASLPRLGEARSEQELHRIIHETFVAYFDADIAGTQAKYHEPAVDTWQAYGRWCRTMEGEDGSLSQRS